MTKRHFIALADALIKTKANAGCTWDLGASTLTWEACRDAIADVCQASNPLFDRQRWLAYIAGECGPSGGKIKTSTSPSFVIVYQTANLNSRE